NQAPNQVVSHDPMDEATGGDVNDVEGGGEDEKSESSEYEFESSEDEAAGIHFDDSEDERALGPSKMTVKSFTISEQLQSQAIFPLDVALSFEFINLLLGSCNVGRIYGG
ncbi:hypothetical protein A2U01_0015704, partial [Trifolium medium]|nr:hypothetical protein [Trifolium medium]